MTQLCANLLWIIFTKQIHKYKYCKVNELFFCIFISSYQFNTLCYTCTKNSASRSPIFNPTSPPSPHLTILLSLTSISNPYTNSRHFPHLIPSIRTSSRSHSPFLLMTQNPQSSREIQSRVEVQSE